MRYVDMKFREYYHNLIVFECDDLTEEVSDKVEVTAEDCFMLCSCFVNNTGMLMFYALGIGKSKEDCIKGIELDEPLGFFEASIMVEYPATIFPWFPLLKAKVNQYTIDLELEDGDVSETRSLNIVDSIRNPIFPDVVLVGILSEKSFMEVEMRMTGIQNYMIEGKLLSVPKGNKQLKAGDKITALPYVYQGAYRLMMMMPDMESSFLDNESLEELMNDIASYAEGTSSGHKLS